VVCCDGTGDNGRDDRRGDGRGGFQTRPYGAVHMVSLRNHAAPHGFAIGSPAIKTHPAQSAPQLWGFHHLAECSWRH